MPPPYGLVYADPPWSYTNLRTGGSHKSGSAQKYPTLSLRELADLPVPEIAAADSILALWATTPLGDDPYQLMERWFFTYKTELYWHKIGRKGTGYWLRGEVEKLLIGIRGKVPAWRHNLSNWLETPDPAKLPLEELETLLDTGGDLVGLAHPTLGHSHKPPAVRDLLRDLTPGVQRVELFATETAEGWDSYGLDLGHDFRDPQFWTALLETTAPSV